MKRLFYVLIVALFSLFLAACDDATVEKVEESDKKEEKQDKKSDENTDKKPEVLKVGETVNFDGLEVTVNEARIEPGGEFDKPQKEQFVVVNVIVNNTTDKEQTVSSMLNVELMDEEDYSYNTTILTQGIQAQLDGSVEAGGKLRGEVPFDVPKSGKYKFIFSDPFKKGKATWEISEDELK